MEAIEAAMIAENVKMREALTKARKAMRVCGWHLLGESDPEEEATYQIAREAYAAVDALVSPDDA